MDIATHALASYALARGLFPRRRWPVIAGMLIAGTIADIDLLSVLFGPAGYFNAHRTYTHSLLGTAVIVVFAVFLTRFLAKEHRESVFGLVFPLMFAAAFHVLLDLFQSEGVALLTPCRPSRFAFDWLPVIDPWILTLLLAGILLPELVRLVSSEIGAKNKSPRGRTGAIVALVLVLAYIGARALLHSASVAALEARSYHGESPRHVAAYPDALSILAWHGVVETQSLLCLVNVPAGPGRNFDPENAECFHKPEPSLELDAAQRSRTAQEYIRVVPFPSAVVAKTVDGYEVVIRSMRDLAEGQTRHRVDARVLLDSQFTVTSEELVWASDVHLR